MKSLENDDAEPVSCTFAHQDIVGHSLRPSYTPNDTNPTGRASGSGRGPCCAHGRRLPNIAEHRSKVTTRPINRFEVRRSPCATAKSCELTPCLPGPEDDGSRLLQQSGSTACIGACQCSKCRECWSSKANASTTFRFGLPQQSSNSACRTSLMVRSKQLPASNTAGQSPFEVQTVAPEGSDHAGGF
jgi:hypothetical protein